VEATNELRAGGVVNLKVDCFPLPRDGDELAMTGGSTTSTTPVHDDSGAAATESQFDVEGEAGGVFGPAAGSIVAAWTFLQAAYVRDELPESVAQTSKATSGGSTSIKSGTRWLDPKSLRKASASAFVCELTAR
jgi:hypothetical protein